MIASASLRRALVTVVLAPTLAAPGSGQAPNGRSCHSMTAAAGLGVVVFGGSRFCGRDIVADSAVWLWNGTTWSLLPGTFPSRREDALLIYDSRRKILVLHGGRAGPQVFRDTWEWDGSSWVRRSEGSTDTPGALEHAAAAFDSARGRVVVFGGGTRDRQIHSTVWEWDGSRWQRYAATGPAARVGHSMAAAGAGVYLYGGFNEAGSLADLWKWNGAAWERIHEAGPTNTEGMALVNSGTGLLVVGAGTGDAGPGTPLKVWRFSGGVWSELPGTGPTLKVGQGVAWDAARRQLVLFGGGVPDGPASNELWEFDESVWRRR